MATKPLSPNGAPRASAKKRIRKIFGDIHEVVQMPNLIEVQRESYEQFLRSNPATGYVSGLEKTLRSVFPIRDFGGTSELELSPNGKEVVFVCRGEVFVTSVKEGTTRRITDTPEQERSVSFSPDGRSILYASERNGSWDLYTTTLVRKEEDYFFNATVLKEEPLLATPAEEFQPAWSPDGKEVAFLEERTTIRVYDAP